MWMLALPAFASVTYVRGLTHPHLQASSRMYALTIDGGLHVMLLGQSARLHRADDDVESVIAVVVVVVVVCVVEVAVTAEGAVVKIVVLAAAMMFVGASVVRVVVHRLPSIFACTDLKTNAKRAVYEGEEMRRSVSF